MKIVSNTAKTITSFYAEENLPPPSLLHWPLNGNAEIDRRQREERFCRGLGVDPPPGLDWIRGHAEAKYRPDVVLEACRTVLVSALPYFRDDPCDALPSIQDAASIESGDRGGVSAIGRVARYARGRDYHKELGKRLKRIVRSLEDANPSHRFRAFVDIGPLDETWLAEASGLGFKGRHSLAILPGLGSWVVLGHIITTLPIEESPSRPSPMACPEGCRRCIDACPTGALSPSGHMNTAACISYQTIEHHGPIDDEYLSRIGDCLFGCDACQEACPFNAPVSPTPVEAFLKDISGPAPYLAGILSLKNHEETVARFAGSPLMRAGREGLVRNACTVAGNSGSLSFLPQLEHLLNDPDKGIRAHAHRALRQLKS